MLLRSRDLERYISVTCGAPLILCRHAPCQWSGCAAAAGIRLASYLKLLEAVVLCK